MARYSLECPKNGEFHAKLVRKVSSRIRLAEQAQTEQHAKWQRAEEVTLAFLPETEEDRLRKVKRGQGEVRFTTIQVPYSFALLMSAHTYITSVFLARTPIHQYTGRHGEGEQQIQAMEALIGYQTDVGRMLTPYYVWKYDTLKYGVGILGEYWDRVKLHYGELVEMQEPDGRVTLYQTTRELEGYQGNCAYNVSPWDFLHDPRVQIKNFQKGEFCACRRRLSWNDILRRRDLGYYNKNVDMLKEHESRDRSQGNSTALTKPKWDQWLYDTASDDSKHPSQISFWEFYVDLIPNEWDVGNLKFPQKWCITITEDLGLIVGVSPLGHYHCEFPFAVAESEIEGYGTFARGVPEIMEPIQNTMDWLLNTHFFNVRAAINNQFILDPSKLVIKDAKDSGPGFIWRLRPEAYGTDIRTMFHQVPVQDVTRTHMQDFQSMFGIGERTLGINDQIMGALSMGGRKTATEVRTSTGFGVNRLKTICEYISASAFSSHSQRLVQNSQQHYDGSQKMRRVGSFVVEAGEAFINVTPNDIAGFYDFVPVDGVLPVDRMAQANLWKEIMIGATRMPPQITAGYDWGRIFAWAAQIGGLKNINQFKVQVLPDQQLIGNTSGNVVPMRPPGGARPTIAAPGNTASGQAGLNSLGLTPGENE